MKPKRLVKAASQPRLPACRKVNPHTIYEVPHERRTDKDFCQVLWVSGFLDELIDSVLDTEVGPELLPDLAQDPVRLVCGSRRLSFDSSTSLSSLELLGISSPGSSATAQDSDSQNLRRTRRIEGRV